MSFLEGRYQDGQRALYVEEADRGTFGVQDTHQLHHKHKIEVLYSTTKNGALFMLHRCRSRPGTLSKTKL